jgi:hypothetical protein
VSELSFPTTPEEHTRHLQERGFTVFQGGYRPEQLAELRATLARLHAAAGSPRCYAREPRRLAPEIELSTTGLVFYKFIKHCPEHAGLLVLPEMAAAIRGYVGEDVELELTGAVIVDEARPFFPWHNHIGGIDDGKCRRAGIWPAIDAPRRLMTLLYVDGTDDENGALLVYPRRVGDPTPPPHDPYAFSWPEEVVLQVPPGTVVVMDECTWHAVRPKRSPGLRSFVGCYFRSPKAPPTEWIDESLRGFSGGGPLLQSLLPPS